MGRLVDDDDSLARIFIDMRNYFLAKFPKRIGPVTINYGPVSDTALTQFGNRAERVVARIAARQVDR